MPTLVRQISADSTGTNIRLWAQFVEDIFLMGGWTITNDTGQTAPANLLAVTSEDQKRGYRIYQMNDSFQATNPVYVRVDYGSGRCYLFTPPPYTPGMWLTIGTGTDGAGVITGTMMTTTHGAGLLALQCQTVSSSPCNCYGSADKGWCIVSLFTGGGGDRVNMAFSIERSKNEAGQDTGHGVLCNTTGVVGDATGPHIGLGNSAYLVLGSSNQFPVDTGLNYLHTTANPSPIVLGHKGIGVVFHFAGDAQQPGLNWLVTNSGDIASESWIKVNIYGQTHFYQHTGTLFPYVGNVSSAARMDGGRRLLMRWE